ncbi:MAG: NAD(P)/FAD-dependent oxidoreductase [Gammaproteobacteria bacterium]
MQPSQPRVVVVGGGFAGLWAARALRRERVTVTLIDRANYHLFQPLLYQVATAGLAAPSIAAPLRYILRRQKNVTVLLGEVERLDVHARQILLGDRPVPYDHLILATGATHAYFGHTDWETHAPGLKSLDDALAIRRRILMAFERAELEEDPIARAAWLTFAVIGGGPTGVELAGTLAEIARHTLAREFRRSDPRTARVLLIEASDRILGTFPPALSARAQTQLERLGVTVLTGNAVTEIGDGYLRLGAERIATRTMLWAAGVQASPIGRQLQAQIGVTLDRAGRVPVNADLSVPGHPEILVAGDLASLTDSAGRRVPGVAPAAKQMGRHAAGNIRNQLRGRSAKAFRYRDYGNLATIGRQAAVVDVAGVHLYRILAWWFWLIAHVFFLIGFRNRLIVLIDWAWSYMTYSRSARIIVGTERQESRSD